MEYFRVEVKVGVFIFLSLVLLTIAALVVGNVGAWFTEKHVYTVWFKNANLLHRRAKVAYAGYPVGEVTDVIVHHEPQHVAYPVAVTLVVRAEVVIPEDSRIELKTDGFIGDHFIDIIPGRGQPLPSGGTIHGVIGGLEGTLASVSEGAGIGDLLGSLHTLIADASQPQSIPATLGSVHQLVEELRPRVNAVMVALDTLLGSLKQDVSSISDKAGQTLTSIDKTIVATGTDLKPLLSDVRTTLAQARQTLQSADTLLGTTKTEATRLLTDLQKLTSSVQRDTAATLERLQKVLARANDIVVQNDRNLYTSIENLRDTLDNLKVASQQVRTNPSVLIFGKRTDANDTTDPNVTRVLRDRGRVGRYDKVQ